jgi:hypothetical protein
MIDLTITKKQLRTILLSEQDTGFTNLLNKTHSTPKSAEKYNNDITDLFSKLLNYIDVGVENDLRDFLYSPEGIAAILTLNATQYGVVITELLFSILLIYDIRKWVNDGEPNWLYLISDLLCVVTSGFASSVGSGMIQSGKTMVFKSVAQFFIWVKNSFPTIWSKFILPLSKNVGSVISKITSTLSKIEIGKNAKGFIPEKIIKSISFSKQYLIKLKTIIETNLEMIISKPLSKGVTGYAEYKSKFEALTSAENTEIGQKIIKKSLPYINPLLGSDKIDPFLLDLITNPKKINLSKYNIQPIFIDNSLDSFT